MLQKRLGDIGCANGFASDGSRPNGVAFKKYKSCTKSCIAPLSCCDCAMFSHPSLIWESKNSHSSCIPGLRQAISEATNVGFSLIKLGMSAVDVRVPVVSSTGLLLKFGLVLFCRIHFLILYQ